MDLSDKKVVDYHLYAAFAEEDANNNLTTKLANGVKEYMKDGWIPLGSPFAFGNHICQALVKLG